MIVKVGINDNSTRKCRFCEKRIDKGETVVVFSMVHVSPKHVCLYFHYKCMTKIKQDIQQLVNSSDLEVDD